MVSIKRLPEALNDSYFVVTLRYSIYKAIVGEIVRCNNQLLFWSNVN